MSSFKRAGKKNAFMFKNQHLYTHTEISYVVPQKNIITIFILSRYFFQYFLKVSMTFHSAKYKTSTPKVTYTLPFNMTPD